MFLIINFKTDRMKKLFITNIFFVLLLFGCRPDSFRQVGERNNYVSQITGSYKLSKVLQSDVKAVKNNYPYKTLDLTTMLPYTDFEVTLNPSTNGVGTFTTKQGNAPAVIRLASGNWSVDNQDAPKMLYFVNGTDSVKIEFGNYTGLRSNQLNLRQVRYLDGKPVIHYDYQFTKK
jgi:hypothetical protein